MIRYRFLRTAAVALELYGILGLAISVAMLVVGVTTFGQIAGLQKNLDDQRGPLIQSLRTASATVRDTASAAANFQSSINNARTSVDNAATLAASSASTARNISNTMSSISLFGIQPLAALAPQFSTSADQLQQLSGSLVSTRDALALNGSDIGRVGTDLGQLQVQLDTVATSLSQAGIFGSGQSLLAFQVAFYGMCLLVILQSAFSLVAGITLYRLQRALGTEALFPHVRRATTNGEASVSRARQS
jgi:uncharacterized phage infection (PIP) family protein YhgE